MIVRKSWIGSVLTGKEGKVGMKEWICEEVPALTIDGKVVSTMLHQEQELVRCKDCFWNSGTEEKPYCQHHDTQRNPNWFCASGEKQIT